MIALKVACRHVTWLIFVLCFCGQAYAADLMSPLPVRNLDPAMMRFFDPTPDSALRPYDQAWSFELNQHYATLSLYDQLPKAQLLIDMELYVVDPVIRFAWSDSLELSVRAPLIMPSSGVFDGPIQNFHAWFNMPNGGRQNRPNNSFSYALNHHQGAQWQARNRWEPGNVELSTRYRLAGNPHWAIAALVTLKLPTASKSRGWGSGAADLGTGLVLSLQQGDWSAHIEGWIIKPFARDEPGLHYKQIYIRGSLSAAYQVFDMVALMMQAQGGGSPYRSTLSPLDHPPFLITFGMRAVTAYGWGWNLAVVENITQVTTQDISITAGINWQFN